MALSGTKTLLESPNASRHAAGRRAGALVDAVLRFPVTHRGQKLEVTMTGETVEYTVREGESLTTITRTKNFV